MCIDMCIDMHIDICIDGAEVGIGNQGRKAECRASQVLWPASLHACILWCLPASLVRACIRACVRACVRACLRAHPHTYTSISLSVTHRQGIRPQKRVAASSPRAIVQANPAVDPAVAKPRVRQSDKPFGKPSTSPLASLRQALWQAKRT